MFGFRNSSFMDSFRESNSQMTHILYRDPLQLFFRVLCNIRGLHVEFRIETVNDGFTGTRSMVYGLDKLRLNILPT